ncbi:DegT/DnrJ/EryC1/StrS family aminotransferase [Treponema endosymbiont of Eucomonympha sp.]|uniref:DegT/DnrJ/EryC1/StrS family aminotransferase n=1 Tax=Treponema endosymbiont of Eucomonympha sp. TaxID=1580831 RepID=UPI000A4638B3|nr:DegT/DnrJ/EryC1/StrS family aminotransferase [Treponema endosymbiont of Eucomonympha sp.]
MEMIHPFSSTIRRKEMDAVLTCMVDEKIGPGEIGRRLAQALCEFFGTEGAVLLRSPPLALSYAFRALDLPAGSVVALSALAPAWQHQCIAENGYAPLALDVNAETAQISAEAVAEAQRNGARLLVLTGTLGGVSDLDAIKELGIPFVEDVSQSAGARYDGRMVGTFGVFSILGLEERDCITGGGGAALLAGTKRDWSALKNLAETLLPVSLLPDINSALAYTQIREFERNEVKRRDLYDTYIKSLFQSRHKTLARTEKSAAAVYGFPVVLSSGFKEVKQYAAKKDIEIESAFGMSATARLGDALPGCIAAKSLALRTAMFPLYSRLGSAQAERIGKVLATLP